MYPRRVAGLLWVVLVGGSVVLTACTDGGGPISTRPGTAVPTLSATLPTRTSEAEAPASPTTRPPLTLPTRSEAPAPTPTPTPTPPAPAPTTPAETRTTEPPTTRTAAPPTQTSAPAPTQAETPTPAATSTPVAAPVSSSSSISPWVWWLLGLLIAGAVIALVVLGLRRRGARKEWDARLTAVHAESTWLAHQLVPSALSAQSAAARRDLWTASRPRVDALEWNLSELTPSAPTDQSAGVNRLRDSVAAVRSSMDAHSATGDAESLGAARQAQRQLEEALRVVQPPPSPDAM